MKSSLYKSSLAFLRSYSASVPMVVGGLVVRGFVVRGLVVGGIVGSIVVGGVALAGDVVAANTDVDAAAAKTEPFQDAGSDQADEVESWPSEAALSGMTLNVPRKLSESFGDYVQALCKTSPSLLIQKMEIDAVSHAGQHSRSENWYPELNMAVGQTHYSGEPNGFFSLQNDEPQTVGQNGALISSKFDSGLVTEAQLNMELPLFQEGHWLSSASDETKVLQSQLLFEQAKYAQILQEDVLELGESLVLYIQLSKEEALQRDLLSYTLSQLDVAVKSAGANLVNRTDVAAVQQRVVSLKSELKNLVSTRLYLKQKINLWVPDVDYAVLRKIDLAGLADLPNVEALIEKQTKNSPEIEMQQASIKVAKYQYKNQRHQNGFKVALGGSVTGIADKSGSNGKGLASVGVNVELKFKDALRTNSRSKYWALQQQKELSKLNLIKQSIRFSTLDLYQAYNAERVNFENSKASLSLAELELEQSEQLYKRGKISFNNVVESRAKITEAKLTHLQSSAKLWTINFQLQPYHDEQCLSAASTVN